MRPSRFSLVVIAASLAIVFDVCAKPIVPPEVDPSTAASPKERNHLSRTMEKAATNPALAVDRPTALSPQATEKNARSPSAEQAARSATTGSNWFSVGSGLNRSVYGLTAFDDGGGAALYAVGDFTASGGTSVNHIAKWDGMTWSDLGSGLRALYFISLAGFDDGSGPKLFVAGANINFGGSFTCNVIKWDGSNWLPTNTDTDYAYLLTVLDYGSGPTLLLGMEGPPRYWNGSNWQSIGVGPTIVYALEVYDAGDGPVLIAGGIIFYDWFDRGIVQWDGSAWISVGGGMNTNVGGGGTNTNVSSLAVFDDGNGPALYAGGNFIVAGGVPANHIAKWDGSSWSAVGDGIDGGVSALTVFDDGSGLALYAAGAFTTAGGVSANNIARWDGSVWTALGDGVNGGVETLEEFDDGTGPALFAAGNFTMAGTIPAERIAKWWVYRDCNANGLHDQCDIDCGEAGGPCDLAGCGTSLGDANADGIPDECCGGAAPLVADTEGTKNRFLSINPGPPTFATANQVGIGATRAIRVTYAPDVGDGWSMFVGPPKEVCEHSAQGFAVDPADCVSISGMPRTFWTATMQCDPYYSDWPESNALYVRHPAIVPGREYLIQTINEGCGIGSEANYSTALALGTPAFGDVVSDCSTNPCGPPNGFADILDAVAVLDKFRNLVFAPHKVRCDLEPGSIDGLVNITDVTLILDAFRGRPYPFAVPNNPCP